MISPLRVEHLNPFLRATIDTMKSMVKVDAVPGKVTLMRREEERFDVSGIIGLSGGARGTVSLCFPRITALKVVSAFAGMRILALDDDAVDAVGELANIIAGAAKSHLSQYHIQMSLPSVVLGENHELTGPKDIIPMAVPFATPHGAFKLIVRFKSEPVVNKP
jgi:chemotaxis protein CheX